MPSWCGIGDTPRPPAVRKYLHTAWLCLLQRFCCGGRSEAGNGMVAWSGLPWGGTESAGRVASVIHEGDGRRGQA